MVTAARQLAFNSTLQTYIIWRYNYPPHIGTFKSSAGLRLVRLSLASAKNRDISILLN